MEFESAVRKYGAERHARGFSSWGQFVAMLFCQLGHAKSLREICGGLAASEGKLRHLGVATAPSRDDLSALAIPTVVIAGSRDEIAGDPQALANAIPGARAVSLPACDHFSAIPHALFKAAVFDFLDGWLD